MCRKKAQLENKDSLVNKIIVIMGVQQHIYIHIKDFDFIFWVISFGQCFFLLRILL